MHNALMEHNSSQANDLSIVAARLCELGLSQATVSELVRFTEFLGPDEQRNATYGLGMLVNAGLQDIGLPSAIRLPQIEKLTRQKTDPFKRFLGELVSDPLQVKEFGNLSVEDRVRLAGLIATEAALTETETNRLSSIAEAVSYEDASNRAGLSGRLMAATKNKIHKKIQAVDYQEPGFMNRVIARFLVPSEVSSEDKSHDIDFRLFIKESIQKIMVGITAKGLEMQLDLVAKHMTGEVSDMTRSSRVGGRIRRVLTSQNGWISNDEAYVIRMLLGHQRNGIPAKSYDQIIASYTVRGHKVDYDWVKAKVRSAFEKLCS